MSFPSGPIVPQNSEKKEHKKEEASIKEFLIERIKNYKIIWDMSHPDYQKSNVRTNCWLKIHEELQNEFDEEALKRQGLDTVEKIKDKWQKMRGVYIKNKNQTVGKSGSAACDVTHPHEVKWQFYSQTQFLDSKASPSSTVTSLNLVPQVKY